MQRARHFKKLCASHFLVCKCSYTSKFVNEQIRFSSNSNDMQIVDLESAALFSRQSIKMSLSVIWQQNTGLACPRSRVLHQNFSKLATRPKNNVITQKVSNFYQVVVVTQTDILLRALKSLGWKTSVEIIKSGTNIEAKWG